MNAVTGVAIGAYTAGSGSDYQYRVYFGASDNKVYCYLIARSGGQTTAMSQWTYTCDGTPVGTPVLGVAVAVSNLNVLYVSDNSGRLHCVKESDGSGRWRSADLTSAGQTITPPLYCKRGLDTNDEYRVYVGRDNGDGHGSLLGFPADASGDATPEMTYPDPDYNGSLTIWPVVSTPAAATVGICNDEQCYYYWKVYFATKDGSLGQLTDNVYYGAADRGDPCPTGDECTTWPIVADSDQIYRGIWADDAYTTEHAVVYGNHNYGKYSWDLWTRWPAIA